MPETDPKTLADEIAEIIVAKFVGAATLEDLALISPEDYADAMSAAKQIVALLLTPERSSSAALRHEGG